MEARLDNPTLFKKIIDVLCELYNEVHIDCNEEGLSFQAMDPSQVSLVSMQLSKKYFDHFECKPNTTLGVDLKSIQKIFKCGNTDDVLVLKTNDNNTELKFQFEKEGRCSDHSLKLKKVDCLIIPESEPEASIRMSSTEFQKNCLDLEQFGDTVNISVRKDKVIFTVNELPTQKSVEYMPFDSESDSKKVDIRYDSNDPLELLFSLKFLNIINKAHIFSEKVTLELSKDRPLLVKFELDDDAGFINYYLAPKVEDEDESTKNVSHPSKIRYLYIFLFLLAVVVILF